MINSKLKKIIFYLFFLVVIMELSARLVSYFSEHGFSTSNYRFISPFFTGTSTPIPVFTDSSGIFANSQEISLVRDDDLRIMCLGGSTTENQTNSSKLRYSDVLNDTLNILFPNKIISVINAGIAAFSSAHSLVNFALRLIEFKPDIIIVMHNTNDRSALIFDRWVYPDYANKYLADSFLDYHHRNGFGAWLLRHFKSFRILKWSSKTIKSMLEYTPYSKLVRNAKDGKRYFRRNMKSIITIAKAHNIVPIIMTQPHRDLSQNKLHQEYNTIISDIALKEKVQIVDLSINMSEKKEYFIDQIHYTEEGINNIANEILPVIVETISVMNLNYIE